MFVSQRFAVGALVVGVVVGLSGSGCAAKTYVIVPSAPVAAPTSVVATAVAPPPEALLNGVYNTLVGSVQAQWTIKSTCTSACTAVVSSSNGGWTGNATLTGNQWDITVGRPNGGSCLNGTTTPSTNHYSWDAATLKGAVDSTYTCAGEPAGLYHSDFAIVTPAVTANS